ncbi:hypothetical protein OsI_15762 [Oryza sativa Indica Group]|uniref:Uncharacterized protein n=1 Tax=Oryza sativa subsp. indica TaxID=39946 RepID=B8ATH0_ORYSI|nr:hypothetical protein OsI_15762 [Oryza sativa Indica Group]
MSPSPLLARPPAPSSPSTYPSLPPRRCAPAVASAALRVAPATASRAPFSRLVTKRNFAASDIREDYSTPIDVVADVKTEKA